MQKSFQLALFITHVVFIVHFYLPFLCNHDTAFQRRKCRMNERVRGGVTTGA